MVATHFGLGLHVWVVNARDPDYPTNLSHTFRHVWITMVLMGSFFLCIKMTLLFFYKRLFLVANPRLRIFWWANFVFIVLWFFGATGFYLFQCNPVQWYFIRYYIRFPHPGKTDLSHLNGQCDATAVLNVSLPVIFSLISDVGLLILPIWAVSTLQVNKSKKRGLLAVFGVGSIAGVLELARIITLNLKTDDKDDTSYGVATFLILTAAEETTAIVCACLPVIAPRLYRKFRGESRHSGRGAYGDDKRPTTPTRWSSRGFRRVASLNAMATQDTTVTTAAAAAHASDDNVPLTYVHITGSSPELETQRARRAAALPAGPYIPPFLFHDLGNVGGVAAVGMTDPTSRSIHVRTDIQTCVTDASGGSRAI
ncbi:putative integral membrane protein [Rosellinia necatrix]|uniref:Putative integral membrane protein n=1 Tax=Rosellinia necatrix TaxID=77044 RepID=A0A1S7UPU8_ROSNE|nr:putative integral membrane protein [Rosellinia necatrix]